MLGRCSTLVDQCSMQFHCSLSGASAPRGPTYSTVQEQQTGFSTWFDDQHAFYVCMGDSLQKKSCRILLEHLKLNGHPARSGFPPLKFRDHNGKKKNQFWDTSLYGRYRFWTGTVHTFRICIDCTN